MTNENDLIQGVVSEEGPGTGDPGRVRRREHIKEVIAPKPGVYVGDTFKFTFDAAKFILRENDHSTVVVRAAEIRTEADGSKTIVCVPE